MKIILREDIASLGKCGEVIEVKPGYARNYLIPKNLAIMATKGSLKAINEVTKQKELRENKKKKESFKLKGAIEKISCTAEVNVGEEDKVFGSVTSQDIVALLKEKGFDIDKKKLELENPIKALGVYTLPIKLHPEVVANLKL
ncbi:MAG: 50S ribosomal protein L9, partial [candidate division Zixibacteria bacterium]|nr:50S ribosomal protein L9 [candidate division Zixibacteria bacterium]